jgi:MoaD family protein
LKISIEYLGHVKSVTGGTRREDVEIPDKSSVAGLLSVLAIRHGEQFKKAIYESKEIDVKPNYIMTVNGYLLNQLQGLGTMLKEGDRVAILPIVSGG